MAEKKSYSVEEVRKIAPGYRGKLENFDPTKVGKKRSEAKPRAPKEKRDATLPAATDMGHPPTAQRNDSIISEAIFGVDVTVTEIAPRQSFAANYAKVVDIAEEIHSAYQVDEKQLDRIIAREEVSYYATALLHLRLIDVKAKQGEQTLTSQEKDLRKATADDNFNVPQPLFTYLKEIGTYTDKMGKETRLEIPSLPVTIVQNFGGYHANAITADSHNLFEEVPSLGIAGDMLMALASEEIEPVPDFHIGFPEGSAITSNLVGRFHPIGMRRPEIKQKLSGFGITANSFAEYVPGTRFNLRYLRSVSDRMGKLETFRIEKVTFRSLGLAGGETQTVKTKPTDEEEHERAGIN